MVPWRRIRPGRPEQPDEGHSARGLESARRSSSLPSGVFKARSPAVEQAIAGGAGDVFLEHMRRIDGALDVDLEPGLQDPESGDQGVDIPAIEALLADLHEHPAEAAPDLADGLDGERTFVLVDLSVLGRGEARSAAVAELLELAHDLASLAGHDRATLERLRAELDRLAAADRTTPTLNQLRHGVEDALDRSGGRT
jgi:hypothetical protein